MEFIYLTQQEYDEFARTHQTRNYLNSLNAFKLKEEFGYKCVFLGVKENKQVVAASGFIISRFLKIFNFAYAQRGFLIDYENNELLRFFVHHLISYFKKEKVVYLKIDPYLFYQERDNEGNVVEGGFNNFKSFKNIQSLGFKHLGFTTGFSKNQQVRFMMTLYLKDKTEKQIFNEMDQHTRWSINKAIKTGVKVRVLNENEYDIFKKILVDTANIKHFVLPNFDMIYRQIEIFGKEDAKILFSYIDSDGYINNVDRELIVSKTNLDKIINVLEEMPHNTKFINKQKEVLEKIENLNKRKKEMIILKNKYGNTIPLSIAYFIFYEDEVVYVSSGSISELKKYNGTYAIHNYMIKEALEKKVTRYNFYGTSGDFNSNADDYGVFQFKKGFNAGCEELIGDFIYPIRPLIYTIYETLKK